MVSVSQIATGKLPSEGQMLTMHTARIHGSGISCLTWGSDCVRMGPHESQFRYQNDMER